MIFSKETIQEKISKGEISIVPFSESNFKEASYSLSLSLPEGKTTLHKGDFRLFQTKEKITLSPKVACMVTTSASVAKRGIDIAQSSIFCEPDTDNVITLELTYSGNEPVELSDGMKIAKAIFVQII